MSDAYEYRILIVEGDEPFRPPSLPGYRFDVAPSPEAALATIAQDPPDAVVLSGRIWQDLVGDAFSFWLNQPGARKGSGPRGAFLISVAKNTDYITPMCDSNGEFYALVGIGYGAGMYHCASEDLWGQLDGVMRRVCRSAPPG